MPMRETSDLNCAAKKLAAYLTKRGQPSLADELVRIVARVRRVVADLEN